MTIACQIVSVIALAPAYVYPGYIRILSSPGVDMTTCIAPCTPYSVIVKWENSGDVPKTFEAKVIVTNIDTGLQTVLFSPGGNVTAYPITGSAPTAMYPPTLDAGRYTLCPIENPANICTSLTVTEPPANITAINIVPDCMNCVIGNTTYLLTVDITWENQGLGSGTFYPGVIWSSSGVPIGSTTSPTPITLDSDKRTTFRFIIELPPGTYGICPDPN